MTPNQQFWLAIIGALVTGLFAPWFVRYLGKRTEEANNDVLFVNASRETVSTVMDVLKEQREINKEFSEKIETLEAALGMKNEYIEALEREVWQRRIDFEEMHRDYQRLRSAAVEQVKQHPRHSEIMREALEDSE